MSWCCKFKSEFFDIKHLFQYEYEEFLIKEAQWHQWCTDERMIANQWLVIKWKVEENDEHENNEWCKYHQRSIDDEDTQTVSELMKRCNLQSHCVSIWQFFLLFCLQHWQNRGTGKVDISWFLPILAELAVNLMFQLTIEISWSSQFLADF
jgi:hypothetical protein